MNSSFEVPTADEGLFRFGWTTGSVDGKPKPRMHCWSRLSTSAYWCTKKSETKCSAIYIWKSIFSRKNTQNYTELSSATVSESSSGNTGIQYMASYLNEACLFTRPQLLLFDNALALSLVLLLCRVPSLPLAHLLVFIASH